MKNKKRSTIIGNLEATVAGQPIRGEDEQKQATRKSREDIISSLHSIAGGGEGTPSLINQAYEARTAQRRAARQQRYDDFVSNYMSWLQKLDGRTPHYAESKSIMEQAQNVWDRGSATDRANLQNLLGSAPTHRNSSRARYLTQNALRSVPDGMGALSESVQVDREQQRAIATNPEQMARWLRMDADAYERKAQEAQGSTRYNRFGVDTGYTGKGAGEYAAQQSLAQEYQSRADAARSQSREVSAYGEQYRRQQQEAARAEQIAEDPAAWMRWAQQQSRAAQQRWESRGTDGAYSGTTDGISGGGAQTAADNAAYDEYQRQLKEADDIYRQAYAALREQEAAGQVPTQSSGDAPSARYRTVNGQSGEPQPRIIGSRAEGNAGTAAITGQRAEAYMSDEQRQTYNYLYATQGEGAAEEYYKLIEPELEQARTQGTQQEFTELSERAPAAMTLLSTLASPAKIAAGLTSVGDALAGDEINTNSAFYTPVHAISAIRQTVPQVTNWTGNKQIFGQDADSYIYGVITSSLDSAFNMALATGLGGIAGGAAGLTEEATNSLVANATSALMGAEMLPDTVMEEKAKGRTDEEATAIAIIRSLIEGVTEKYSIEYFLGDPTTFGKKLGKAFLAEGSEEVASNWLNNIVDVVSSDPENVLQQWRDRVDSGENGALALAEVVGGMLSEDAASFIAGGISGLGMGAVHEGIQRAGQDKQAYRLGALGQSDAQAVVDEALAINPDSKAAQRAKARLDAGKGVRSVQLGRIMAESDAAILPQEQALAEASKKYGKQAGALQATYDGAQDVQRYDEAYHVAYEMGRAGANLKAAQTSMATGYLSQEQRQAAWEAGRDSMGAGSAADIANGRALLGGQIAAVQSISERDGKVYAEILQGTETKRVALEDLKMDAGTKMLAESAKQYGAAAPTIFEQYRKGQQLTQYLRSADMAVSVGMASPSASAETVLANLKSGQLGKVMSAAQIEALYKAGQQAGKAQLRKTGMTRLGTGSFTLEDSAKGTKLDKRQRAALRFLRDLARVTGLDISVYKSSSGADGTLKGANGSYVDGRIRVDLNAGAIYEGKLEDASMLRTVSHELTHFMAETAEAEFKELQSFLVEKLSAWEGHSIQDLVDEKLALAKSHGRDISTEEALEEVVADGCEMMLRDSKAIRQLAEENRTLFEKVRDWMTRFFDALRKAFEGVEAVHPESIHMMENYAEELQKLWDEALTAAVRNAKESGQKNSAPAGVDAAYSERYHSSEVNDDLLALIDRVASGNFRANERVYFGIVSDDIAAQIFAKTKIRVDGFRMAIEARQIEHILKDHGKNGKTDRSMKDWTDIARMEYALRNPDSLTNAGRTQAYTYMKYGYNRTAPTVLYEKRIGEKSYYVVQAVPDTTARTLFVVTAFIGKSANKNGASQLIDVIDVNYPNATPENGSASAPNSTIAQNKGGSQEGKFSLRGSVEETHDLIAVHNLTEENLVSSLDIGGLPSPSIAIIKAAQGHSKYGPISIVFDKSTIDPQADSRNKIYGSDAWTPTVPRVEYQVNSKMLSQIERELHRLAGDTSVAGGIFGNSSALRSMGIDDTSNLNRKQLAEKLASTDTVRAAYLADQGQTLEPVKMDKVWDKFGNDTLQKVIDRLGVNTLAEMEANLEVGESAENALGENAEVIRDILRDYYRKQGEPMLRRMAVKKHWTAAEISEKRQTRIENSVANVSVFTLEDIVRHAWEMYQDGGNTKGEIDRLATSEALRSAVDDHAVEEWIAGKLDGLLGKAGIYNGKDRYTPSGNSRSFAQLHYDYTLENIVRAMNGLQQARGEGIWGASAESFVAVGTPDYRSIDEVRADKGRLREATEEEYDALKAKLDPMIEEIIAGIRSSNKAHSDNQFEEIDIIGSLLLDAAKGTKTKAAIRSVFRKNGYAISDALIAKAQSLYSEAAKMPTKYFEAKPQRAVSFDEAKAIIVPDNTSAALVRRLEQGGANVISYKAGDEQARLEALNAQEGVKFSERGSWYDDQQTLQDYEVEIAIADAMDHGDSGYDNLIRVGRMPRFVRNLVGIDGDFYLYRNHAYENIVSEKRAKQDGRQTVRNGKKIHFHAIGEAKMVQAIMSLENPVLTIGERTRHGNPAIKMVLPITAENGLPLYAALSFYDPQNINGKFGRRAHIVLTISDGILYSNGDHEGYVESINRAIADGNVLSYDKKNRAKLSVIAQHTRLGNITDSALATNLSRFREYVNNFRARNKINYQERDTVSAEIATLQRDIRQMQAELRKLKGTDAQDLTRVAQYDAKEALKAARQDTKVARAEGVYIGKMEQGRAMAKQMSRMEAQKNAQIARLEQRIAETQERMNNRIAEQRQRLKDYRENRNESEAKQHQRKQVEKQLDALAKMLTTNNDKLHVPEWLKQPVKEMLEAIMPMRYSKSMVEADKATKADLNLARAMEKIRKVVTDNDRMGAFGYLDLPPEFFSDIDYITDFVSDSATWPLYAMTSAQLKRLNQALTTLVHSIRQTNQLITAGHFQSVAAASEASVKELRSMTERKLHFGLDSTAGKAEDVLRNFLSWKNTTPYYAFRRFGEGGQDMYRRLADGWDRLAFNSKAIMDFAEDTYTEKEVKAWEKEKHTVTLDSGEVITLSTANAMEFYELSKRQQALGHLLGGGIRVANQRSTPAVLTTNDIDTIIGLLTDRQRVVADKLQEYMELQGSEWGNEVSMKRFGYRYFTEQNYYPVVSDSNELSAKNAAAQENSMYRLLNLSMTKGLQEGANNAIVIGSIFDTFASHMSDMAKYNALALPILDTMKWFNYRLTSKNEAGQLRSRNVRQSIEAAYGSDALAYFTTFMEDLNGANSGGRPRGERFANKMTSNMKVASVAANLRVAGLQATSIARAATVISPKYLLMAQRYVPQAVWHGSGAVFRGRENGLTGEMLQYSGIARWKSLGFFDTNVGRNIQSQIKNAANLKEKVVEKSMSLAELGDTATWTVLWGACKMEQKAKGFTGQELLQKTAERFREVVYATQVVDSTMTRSHMMRSKNGTVKNLTPFMSEPTLTYNVLLDAAMRIQEVNRKGGNGWKTQSGHLFRAFTAFTMTSALSAIIESLSEAARDDDDDPFLDKFLDALLGEKGIDGNLVQDMVPIGNLPYLNDAVSILQGYSSERMETTWMSKLYNVIQIAKETEQLNNGTLDGPTKITSFGSMTEWGKLYKVLDALSTMVGLPIAAFSREVTSIWNATIGAISPRMKIKRYENKDQKFEWLYTFAQSGSTADYEKELAGLRKVYGVGGKKTEDEITENIQSGMREKIQAHFLDGDISAEEAQKMLDAYTGAETGDAKAYVAKWSCEKDLGVKYDDLKDLYLAGELTDEQAVEYRVKYGLQDEEKAQDTIAKWHYEKETGNATDSAPMAGAYFEYAEPAGIEREMFETAWAFKQNAEGEKDSDGKTISGSVKAQVVEYIQSLGLNRTQAKALWDAVKGDWKDKDTPWA